MRRRTCLRCGGRVERDDFDLPRCPTCGEVDFCCEECRDGHAQAAHGHPGYPHAGYTKWIAAPLDAKRPAETFAQWLDRQVLR